MNIIKKAIATAALCTFALATLTGSAAAAETSEGKLKIGAKFYINGTSSKTDGDGTVANNGKTQSDSIGAALDRAYFMVRYQFDDVWSLGLTTDANIDTTLSGKKTNVYIKHAYARGKFSEAAVLDLGVIGTPWIPYEEGLNKHRYIFKVFTDQHGFDSSADAGIGLAGKLADGLIQYAVAEVNGGGYANITKTKSLDLNSRIGIYPVEGLTLDVQFRDGHMGSKSWDKTLQADFKGTKHTLIQGMLTYGVDDTFRVGGNYIHEKSDIKADAVHAITQLVTKTTGYNAWGWVNFGNNIGAFGRYEFMKQKQDFAVVDAKTNSYIAGLEYFPRKNITLAAVVDYSKTKNALYNTGAIIKTTKYGLYSEFKF